MRHAEPAGRPLTPAQTGIWFAQQMHPESPAYNGAQYVEIRGPLDHGHLATAVRRMLMESGLAAARFVAGPDHPRQVDDPGAALPWTYLDLTAEADPRTAALTWMRADLTAPVMVTGTAPLVAEALFKIGDDLHLWYQRAHHLLLDGYGFALTTQRVAGHYGEIVTGVPAQLPVLQPAEPVVAAEQEYRASAGFARDGAYWAETLRGVPAPVTLSGRVAPVSPTFLRTTVPIPGTTLKRLEAVAAPSGTGWPSALAAVMAAYLHRMTTATDVLIGLPASGRTRPPERTYAGTLSTILPLRLTVSPTDSLSKLAEQAGTRVWRALRHQRYRIEDIRRDLRLAGTGPELIGPVVNVIRFTGAPAFGRATSVVHNLSHGPVYDFSVSCVVDARQDGVHLDLDANPALYDEATLTGHRDRFLNLLSTLLDAPEQPIGEADLRTGEERLATPGLYGEDHPIPATHLAALFEAQVARTPDAPAVMAADGSHRLTYAELDDRANRLARLLAARSAEPEKIVAVALPRSVHLVEALLAVVKSGAAYLPIDPAQPAERTRFQTSEAGAVLTVTERPEPGALALTDPEVVSELAAGPGTRPASAPHPDNPAYVMFTSGSTGRPKGVMVSHRSIVNRLLWMQDEYRLDATDRVLLKTPATFDVSVWEFFWPLVSGATLVVADPDGHRDPRYLSEIVERQGITTLHFVPSMLRAFLPVASGVRRSRLRRVLCSGEALDPVLRADAHRILGTEIHNLYGPTEAAVDVTAWHCPPDPCPVPVPIGRPVWNTRLYILDSRLRPLPAGTSGELYLAGVQLARGYVARTGVTAERFVADPWGPAGERMYRTGDLARWRPDGSVEYVGRVDHQVKIRGQRVELGEIETTLRDGSEVADAVVLADTRPDGDVALVGYVVPGEGESAVRHWLKLEHTDPSAAALRRALPNGMAIAAPNAGEAEFLYREIFKDGEYLRHGITIVPDACVVDVGAHVGMFTLLVAATVPNATVHAVEPMPELFRMLELNTAIHGVNARLHPHGLAEAAGDATFTYYPNLSIMSGRFGDSTTDRDVVESFTRQQFAADPAPDGPAADRVMGELLDDRMRAETVSVQLTTLSAMIRAHAITRIDLLKIDAEKSELEILRGVEPEHWPLIHQVVAEVHDIGGRLREVVDLLTREGFAPVVEEQPMLRDTRLVMVYATRAAAPRDLAAVRPRPVRSDPEAFAAGVRARVQAWLPAHMVPAVLVPLDVMPLTSNGKLDRNALPAPPARRTPRSAAPRTPVEEQLCGLFAAALGLDRVGIDEDFFALGGHSLSAAGVLTRIRELTGADLPMRAVFDHPTVAALSGLVAASADAPSTSGDRIGVRPVPPEPPLSPSQQGLWFLHQIGDGSPSYHMAIPVELDGELDISALDAALADVADRHEPLRTVLPERDGQPYQRILPSQDLAGLARRRVSPEELDAAILEWATSPFDLERDPPARSVLLELGPRRHVLLLVVHHIAADGWSLGVLGRDLATAYRSRLAARPPDWPPLPARYADYAVWQAAVPAWQWQAKRDYWAGRLTGLPDRLRLPADKPRPPVVSSDGASVSFATSPESRERLSRITRDTGTTDFMVWQAALAVLLSRLGAGPDIPIGTIAAGRSEPEVQQLVGCFVNTVVLRTDVSGNPSFTELLSRVRTADLADLAHGDLPFEQVVEAVNPSRAGGHHPLVQTVLTLTHATERFELAGMRATHGLRPIALPVAKFDLTIDLFERPSEGGYDGLLHYRADLFSADAAQALADRLIRVLDAATTHPDRPISRIELLSEEERRQLATGFGE